MKLSEIKKKTQAGTLVLLEGKVRSEFMESILNNSQFVLLDSLIGAPSSCPDISAAAASAHAQGSYLALNNSIPSFMGALCLRAGADLVFENHGELLLAYSARDELTDFLSSFSSSTYDELDEQVALTHWKEGSDRAAALVAYLECHPKCEELFYPGRPLDESFERATKLYEFGFGPYVSVRFMGREREDIDCTKHDLNELILQFERY